jgi:hypothetical protein
MASGAFAQQIATASSSATFTLRGASVDPTQGVPTFPLMPSDIVKAGKALTLVTFPDGATILLDPASEGRVDVVEGRPVFRLLKGQAEFRLRSLTTVGLAQLDQSVVPTQLAGTLLVGGSPTVGAGSSHAAVYVAVGGGAAAAAGLGLAKARSGGSSVSPSQP